MSDSSTSESAVLLDGPLERASFPPLLSAVLGLIGAFLLFQGISTVVLLLVALGGSTSLDALLSPDGLASFLANHAGMVIWANTIGQIFGLLVPGLILTRLHSRHLRGFLRFRSVDWRTLLLAVAALAGLIPLVHFSASLTDSLPWPQWIRDLEEGQMQLIEQILTQDFSLLFAVSMLALTPAICEEVLFRGFIQRQAERSLGAWGGILFSGIIFGLYHLRLTQAIPLSMLGIFMAWLTWRTRSIWPAILVHFLNNGLAAVLGKFSGGEASEVDLEAFDFPWWALLLSVVVLVSSIAGLQRKAVRPPTIPNEEGP
ncbi:MAG: CPBP family intramembrane metalloprotease [Bacteroidetes bacterium]|nr:CPBP family intramembrane metalloprotease [Bacteroidota bacterium]